MVTDDDDSLIAPPPLPPPPPQPENANEDDEQAKEMILAFSLSDIPSEMYFIYRIMRWIIIDRKEGIPCIFVNRTKKE